MKKRLLAVALAVVMILSSTPFVFAADVVHSGQLTDTVSWSIDSDGVLTISGSGSMGAGEYWYDLPWFDYNDEVYSVVIAEGVTDIIDTAFYQLNSIKTISIPSTVESIEDSDVFVCESLEVITVSPDNEYFTSELGILYNIDKTKLIYYPSAKAGDTFTIPASVTEICEEAFKGNTVIKNLIVPDTVKLLNEGVFYGACIEYFSFGNGITELPSNCFFACDELKRILIPESVTSIGSGCFMNSGLENVVFGSNVKSVGNYAFYNTKLTHVHYLGTQEQFEATDISSADNDLLTNATVHYISEDDFKSEGSEPTCLKDGSESGGYFCEECEEFVSGVVIPATGHDMVNGVCGTCGEICSHIHNDLDGICDLCGCEVPYPEMKVGDTITYYLEEAHIGIYYQFVPTISGEYRLYSAALSNADDSVVTVYDSNLTQIAYLDDTDSSLLFDGTFEAVAGETYYFFFSSYDNDATFSATLAMTDCITHQPTTDEPYVELSNSEGATYEWCKIGYSDTAPVEFTDENADPYTYDSTESGIYGAYDPESGWSGCPEYYNYCYFFVTLNAHDKLFFEVDGTAFEVGVSDWLYDSASYSAAPDADGKAEVTVPESGVYVVYAVADEPVNIRVYKSESEVSFVEGQSAAELTATEDGIYYCVATFANGTVKESNTFDYKAKAASKVLSVDYPKTAYVGTDFTFKVDGRADKIQFVVKENTFFTATYTRAMADIVSYDADGNVVGDLSREIAYEVWTVHSTIQENTYYIHAKYGSEWEPLESSLTFDFELSRDRKDIYSISHEECESHKLYEFCSIRVETGLDVVKVQTVVNGKVTATFNNPEVGEESTVFNVRAKMYNVGENTVTFRIKTADGWEDIDNTLTIVAEK
ncbi:MAG: leucine-rich repeat domain-containing protein [Clostridia bacterium]|nr:leucine-rich repeat domain-containing protein [Clostridia bacterium]